MKILILLMAAVLNLSVAQRLQDNPCGQYFKYVLNGIGSLQGELTIPLQNGVNRIDIRFSQRGAHPQSVVGALLPYPDEATVRANLGAAKFRLSLLPDARGVPPKLTRLAYNNIPLCSDREYSSPQSFFNRFFVLPVGGQQLVRPFPKLPDNVEIKFIDLSDASLTQFTGGWLPGLPTTASTTPPAQDQSWFTTTTTTVANIPEPVTPETRMSHPNVSIVAFVCGQEGLSVPFIQRGVEFPRGRYPWLTALYHKESFSLGFKCGGSLISTSLVITAAHCVHEVKEDRVLLAMGRYDLDDYNEDGAEVRNARRILIHPEFSTRLQLQPDADIALITLDRPVIFNDIIRPICLWDSTLNDVSTERGTIAGWGTDENGNTMTRYPRVVEAKIASARECAQRWKVQKDFDRTLCAGNLDGSGPCLGDSGGGLMVKRGNRWLLRGIVSQGERSTADHCNNKQYVLYCDLAKHLSWITQYLN